MPAEDPVCARTGMLPKALHRPTAAAVAIATARDAGFIGRILLGVLATIIWDRYQSRRHGTKPLTKPLTKSLAKLWLEPLTVNLRAGQLTASAFAKAKQGRKKARECGSTGARTTLAKVTGPRHPSRYVMLGRAGYLLRPSERSGVPPFMVMDVVAAAARLEAQGRRIIHMEVGQPAAGAPAAAIAAARDALGTAQLGYTETLGTESLRRRIALALRRMARRSTSIRRGSWSRPVRLPASFWPFWPPSMPAIVSPSRSRGIRLTGTSSSALGCEPVAIETSAATRWALTAEALLAEHRTKPLKGVVVASPDQSERHHDDGGGTGRAHPLRRRCRHRRDFGRDLSRPRLCVCRRNRRAASHRMSSLSTRSPNISA